MNWSTTVLSCETRILRRDSLNHNDLHAERWKNNSPKNKQTNKTHLHLLLLLYKYIYILVEHDRQKCEWMMNNGQIETQKINDSTILQENSYN